MIEDEARVGKGDRVTIEDTNVHQEADLMAIVRLKIVYRHVVPCRKLHKCQFSVPIHDVLLSSYSQDGTLSDFIDSDALIA